MDERLGNPAVSEYYNSNIARRKGVTENQNQFLALVYRQWWHVLYDEAPALLNCFDDNGKKFLESVLIKLGDKFCLNEKIHIYLIDYIKNNHFDIYTKKIEEELLNSACILWVRTNASSFRGIVIYSKGLNIFFVGSKSRHIGEEPDVEQFQNREFEVSSDLVLTTINQDFETIENYNDLIKSLRRYDEKK